MSVTTMTREFTFDADETCKVRWTFHIGADDDGAVIEDVEIEGYRTEPEGRERGCLGHPKTISALLRGRPLADLDAEELAEATCARDQSCGQALAECLQQLKSEFVKPS